MENVTTVFRYFETGLREATILPKVKCCQGSSYCHKSMECLCIISACHNLMQSESLIPPRPVMMVASHGAGGTMESQLGQLGDKDITSHSQFPSPTLISMLSRFSETDWEYETLVGCSSHPGLHSSLFCILLITSVNQSQGCMRRSDTGCRFPGCFKKLQ